MCGSRRRSQTPAMRFDNRAADRQTHPHPFDLGGEERVEQSIEIVRCDARTGILDRDMPNEERGITENHQHRHDAKWAKSGDLVPGASPTYTQLYGRISADAPSWT